jgi:uncharacterized membrane protein YhaH (DUF805 family)
MNWINLFTGFDGRISRQPFWIGVLVLAVLEIVLSLATYQSQADRLASIVDLILTYPEFAVAAKRAHDREIGTWIVALFFAGSVVFDLLVLAGWADKAAEASTPITAIILLWGVFGLILLADLGLRPGTEGPNRFGPDPLTQDRSSWN